MFDLSQFNKKARGKLRLAIYFSRLLHLVYILVKHNKKHPELLRRYETYEQAVRDEGFVKEALRKEAQGKPMNQKAKKEYAKLYEAVKERGYEGLLDLLDTIWNLTVVHRKINAENMFRAVIGLTRRVPWIEAKFIGHVLYNSTPFYIRARDYRFLIIEADIGMQSSSLAKTLIYIGRLTGTDSSMGLFARFSVRSIDTQWLISNQEKGYANRMLKKVEIYPTVLRVKRQPKLRVSYEEEFEDEVINMLSELYMSGDEIASLVSMDVHANVMAMAPSIDLSGGLCFPTAFRGELLEAFGARKEASIKVEDTKIKGYQSFSSVLPKELYPREYVFMALHPFTAPRTAIITATYPTEILDKIKPKKRNITALDNLFPKLEDITKLGLQQQITESQHL